MGSVTFSLKSAVECGQLGIYILVRFLSGKWTDNYFDTFIIILACYKYDEYYQHIKIWPLTNNGVSLRSNTAHSKTCSGGVKRQVRYCGVKLQWQYWNTDSEKT